MKASFDQVTQAQTEIRTRVNSAEQEAQRSVQATEAEKYRLGQLAQAYANEQSVLARAEVDSFERRLRQYQEMKRDNPDALTAIWWDEMGKLLAKLRESGRVDVLDHHLGPNGLDITEMIPPKKK